MITLGGGFSKGSMTSGSRCGTKTRSRSSRLAVRHGGHGHYPFRKSGMHAPTGYAAAPQPALEHTSEVHRMKSALSVTPDQSAGEEPDGEVLAIRGGRPLTGRVEVKG